MLKLLPDWLVVFIWFFLSLSIFYSGHLYSNDTVTKLESAGNFIEHGSFHIDGSKGAWGHTGRDEKIYPHFSIGSIIMMMPPVLLHKTLFIVSKRQLSPLVLGALTTGMNLLYSVLIGVLIFVLLMHCGQKKKNAFVFTNIIIFCTEIFPYSSSGWSEPAAFLWGLSGFVVLMTDRIIPGKPYTHTRWVIWSLCVGIASLIRIEYSLFFFIFIGVSALYDKKVSRRQITSFFVLCMMLSLHVLFNYYRYESYANFGYADGGSGTSGIITALMSKLMNMATILFSVHTLKDIYWLFLSFGKYHWFWVSPLLFLCLWIPFYRKRIPRQIWILFISAVVFLPVYIFLIDTFYWCCMSWCWAYRYFYVTFPYLLLPLVFLPLNEKPLNRLYPGLCITGLIIGLFVSVVNFHVVLEKLVLRYGFYETMWSNTTAFFWNAPFWTHVSLFPKQFINTMGLIVKGSNLPSWDVLRVEYLDIWPVGLCGAGVNSFVAFGLWLLLILVTVVFGLKIGKPRYIRA